MKLLEKVSTPPIEEDYKYLKRKIRELADENKKLRKKLTEKERTIEELKEKIQELT